MSEDAEAEPVDPLMDGLVAALMEHAAPAGAVDFSRASGAFAVLMAEMIGPQPREVQQAMVQNFNSVLQSQILLSSIRANAAKGAA